MTLGMWLDDSTEDTILSTLTLDEEKLHSVFHVRT